MFFWMRKRKQIHENQKGGVLLSRFRNLLAALKRISFCSSESSREDSFSPTLAPPVRHVSDIFALHGPVHKKASMTIEACLVLSLFLFAFLNIISIIELYRLQGNMSLAMHDTVKQMAVYGYEYQALGGDDVGAVESLGMTYLYAAGRVKAKLGADYLDNSPLAGGTAGISWLRSSVMQEDDCIDLVAEYLIKAPVADVGFGKQAFYNRMRTRAWTGYDNAKNSASSTNEEEIVYITPEGTVYHRSRGCSYLKLSITSVDKSFLDTQRNQNGGKYYACSECGASCGNTVYITQYGDKYHATLSCNRLKRTILAVPISETGGRGACSKCG